MELSLEKKIDLYRQMHRIRALEETIRKNFFEGKLQGFIHIGVGEEAAQAGVVANLTDEDYFTPTHRGHGSIMLKGADPKDILAELAGRATGLCKGRGGSIHLGDLSKGIMGVNGILGAGSPLALGPALAAKIQGEKSVSLIIFGDGQSNEGAHHEAMNMAAAFKLPVVFVCINNMYGMWTRISDAVNISDLSQRASGYGMPGVTVDGNDVLAVYEAVKEAVDMARNGDGPSFLELKTYRWYDHSLGLRDDFRPKEEVAAWKAKDPVKRFNKHLLDEGVEQAKLDKIKADSFDEMNAALKYALEQPFPDVSTVCDYVYYNMDISAKETEHKA